MLGTLLDFKRNNKKKTKKTKKKKFANVREKTQMLNYNMIIDKI